MNLFNSFQAVGLYTLTPFLIQWLFTNQYQVWGYIASAIMFVGFIFLSNAVYDSTK